MCVKGLDDGISFNTGVVYLPPSGVRDGVAELIRVNPDLEKIVMITEKIAVHDAREIRALGQANGIDIFGANCLGVADSWNRVRHRRSARAATIRRKYCSRARSRSSPIPVVSPPPSPNISRLKAGARPRSSRLERTSTSTTLRATSRMLSRTTMRSKAAVLYAEPGGYYERGLEFGKPVVACVVGRWKSKLTRAVGHAGAMAGSGDKAEDKERWFMESFGVQRHFHAGECRVVSAKGAVVDNIAHIPPALTAVMKLNSVQPGFRPARQP